MINAMSSDLIILLGKLQGSVFNQANICTSKALYLAKAARLVFLELLSIPCAIVDIAPFSMIEGGFFE
jgi:hypothetical protein